MLLARVPLADETVKVSHQTRDTVADVMTEPRQARKFDNRYPYKGSRTKLG
jgi:hypothetical protein